MKRRKPVFLVILLLLLFQSSGAFAQYIMRDVNEEEPIREKSYLLPYAFSTETLDFGAGLAASYGPLSESIYFATAFYTANNSCYGMIGGRDVRVPFVDRLHVNPWISAGHYTHMRIYIDGNPHYSDERAGSNDSDEDNYIEEDANDIIADFPFRFTLPIGTLQDSAVHTYVVENGMLKSNPSGGESWNPLKSGISTLIFRPYYRKQYTDEKNGETLFGQLGYELDNRDYIPNPHKGYLFSFNIAHDPGWLADSRRWTSLDAELNGYIPLWDTSWSRQQTLALSVWSAYSPTYDSDSTSDGNGEPPYFTGPTLGGFWRMRGYPVGRFHDKSALYYSAEYRLMPEWQPFGDISVLDPLKIRWWQVVGLVELGRVAPSWDFSTLNQDMKYDYGVGLRGMFDTLIGRIDFIFSDEGFVFSAMFGQTF